MLHPFVKKSLVMPRLKSNILNRRSRSYILSVRFSFYSYLAISLHCIKLCQRLSGNNYYYWLLSYDRFSRLSVSSIPGIYRYYKEIAGKTDFTQIDWIVALITLHNP